MISAWIVALVPFGLSFAAAVHVLETRRPLLQIGGLTDEWLHLGANLNVSGTLGHGNQPIVMRPPAYPFFIAAVLRIFTGRPAALTDSYVARAVAGLCLAQAFVLGLAAAMLYGWMSRWVRPHVALAAALAFGLNPYSLVLPGLMHYDVLHWLLMIGGLWLLGSALEDPTPRPFPLFVAGLAWGIATLLRPLTLILPPFLGLALLLGKPRRPRLALGGTAVFTLGLTLAITPWTARNYAVAGELIPVNRQAWTALWGSTVKPLDIRPNHYTWFQLGPEMMAVFTRVTGEREYSYRAYVHFNAQLDRAFRREALDNLRKQPFVYLGNVASSLVAFNLGINSVLLRIFEFAQRPAAEIRTEWLHPGHPQGFPGSVLSCAFTLYFYGLTAAAMAGAWLAARGRERAALAPGAVYLCLCVAHALFFMDLFYYYVKLPFLFAFAFLLADRSQGRQLRLPGTAWRAPLDVALLVLLTLPALLLSAFVL